LFDDQSRLSKVLTYLKEKNERKKRIYIQFSFFLLLTSLLDFVIVTLFLFFSFIFFYIFYFDFFFFSSLFLFIHSLIPQHTTIGGDCCENDLYSAFLFFFVFFIFSLLFSFSSSCSLNIDIDQSISILHKY